MKSPVKKILAVAVAALGLAAVAAPSVTVNSVTENGTWSKIDVKYTLSGVDTSADYKVQFDVTADGVTKTTTDSAAKKSNASYTKTIDTKSLFGAAKRDAKAKVKVSLIPGFTPDVPVPDAVQLWAGGPYFATFNIGASKPEESGYYFWWGDTVGYKRYSSYNGWVSAKDGSTFLFGIGNCPTYGKSASQLLSAGWIDSTGNLTASHDAARAHLGGSWRMPTSAEFDALKSNCTATWTTQNGVNGYKVTGKATGYTNKSIFLPAAGGGSGDSITSGSSYGYYWSSTPSSNSSYAWDLDFNLSDFRAYDRGRYFGFPVRPVRGLAE